MICKEGAIDVTASQQQQAHIINTNGFNTLQHRRKSQLITFSASSSDIKHNLGSHEVVLFNNGSIGGGTRHSIVSNASSNTGIPLNARLSFAEEDIMVINHVTGNTELEDEVFRRNSLEEADQGVEGDVDMDEELFDDELLYCGTHISASHNANDDSGGGSGSYEDSHALHSSIGGSNRNSLEKDDDDVDVISTDVSCYDQLVGSAGTNITLMMRHDDNGDSTASYAKLKVGLNGSLSNDGSNNGGGGGITKGGDCGGAIYANPFMGL